MSFLPIDPNSSIATIAILATDLEYFNKNGSVAATPNQIALDGRIQNGNISNQTLGLSILLAPGQSVNLFNLFLQADETVRGFTPSYFTVGGAPQSFYLDELNDKYVFPSNLNTYNKSYVDFDFRTNITIDHGAIGSNQSTTLSTRLRRAVDDSIIVSKELSISNRAARTDYVATNDFHTFVNGEADPFVLDGMYIDAINEADSDTNFTIKLIDIDLFRI